QFGKRLATRGAAALKRGDPQAIYPFLRQRRAEIFNADAERVMFGGVIRHIETLLDEMPGAEEIGIENFVDLLVVRSRFPNVAGIEQARVDAEILDVMPFAQPSFLRAVFATTLAERRSGRLFRRIIHRAR